LGDRLGARQAAPELRYPGSSLVDFKKVRATAAFPAGIDQVIEQVRRGHRLALLCAEKDPFDCHRFVLVSYALAKRCVAVSHILAGGETVSNELLEEKLLATCKINFQQPCLFDKPGTRADALEQCYDRRNRDIGFCVPSQSETG
jgi:hypothetical protein